MKKDYSKATAWILIGIITLSIWGLLANWILGVL